MISSVVEIIVACRRVKKAEQDTDIRQIHTRRKGQ